MKIHELKTKPEYFGAARKRQKNFEIRRDDRDFQVGDLVKLEEFDNGKYTGRHTGLRPVLYVLRDCPEYGLAEGYCVIGF